MIGLYYAAPLLGSALGPILGGSLTQGFDWRAVFWFLVIFASLNFFSFLLLFKDTFRRERSSTYQAAIKKCIQERDQTASQLTTVDDSEKDPSQLQTGNNVFVKNAPPIEEIKLSLRDVNPFPPLLVILQRRNNLAILFPSGKSCLGYSSTSFLITFRFQAFSLHSVSALRIHAPGHCLLSTCIMHCRLDLSFLHLGSVGVHSYYDPLPIADTRRRKGACQVAYWVGGGPTTNSPR
jgi:MFS family permease